MLREYLPLADTARIYDNSAGAAVLIADKTRDQALTIRDNARWARLKELVDEGHDGS